MAVDFNKGMRPNLYELMQEGPGGELQPATTETLGGVIIGRGINVEEDGTISVIAPAPVDSYTKEEIDAQQEAQDYNINSNALAIERLEDAVDDTYSKADIDSQQQAQDASISANASDIVGIKGDVDTIKVEQITQNTNISVNAQSILAHTNQINSLAAYNDTQDDAIAANTTAISANTTAIANNANAIQNEATARENMDSTLAANIATNVAAIAAEVANRENADSELSDALDALTTALETLATTIATDSTLGLIKTDSAKNIETDANGKLIVKGRLGQFSSQEVPNGGVYYPETIEPTSVGSSSFLMTDGAKGLNAGPREFCILAGANLTCRRASAGATTYNFRNTQANRGALFAAQNGFAAIDQTDATENGTAKIVDISFENGNPISFYFGVEETDNDIIVTLERTINPETTNTKMRIYGFVTGSDIIAIGQGTGAYGGKAIALGQSCYTQANQVIALGNGVIVLGNNSAGFGHTHLINKQFCFAAGQGHDFTNGKNGSSAVGIASDISNDTLFAVGNGVYAASGAITRSNAFEVVNDGIILKSPNETRFKIIVDNSGNLVTTQL